MKNITLMVVLLFLGCAESQLSPVKPNTGPKEAGTYEMPVARVNGHPINRDTFQKVLWKSYGRQLLDELVQLEMVRQEAQQKGIRVTDQHLSQELNRLLEDMAPRQSRSRQLELLKYMLQSRGMARGQLDLILERQALLRLMVDQQIEITEEQIKQQYEQTFGRKVTVRQLVVSSLRRMEEAKRALSNDPPAVGAGPRVRPLPNEPRPSGSGFIASENFTQIVAKFSEDQKSLTDAGLVGPFSRANPEIPIAIRQTAFTLKQVGQLSEIVEFRDEQNNQWWALLRLEDSMPPDARPLSEVRDQLSLDFRRQTIASRIAALQKTIQDKARVTILDSDLQPPGSP